MRRRYWVTFVTTAVLLVAGHVAYWQVVAARLRTEYQETLATLAAHGWSVGSSPASVGGWPRAATLTVPNLTLRHARPATPGDLSVASADVVLSVSLLAPTDLRLSLAGPVHLRVGGMPDAIVTAEKATVSLPLQRSDPLAVALHARDLRFGPATQAWHVSVGLLNGQAELIADASQPAVGFAISSEAVALPGNIKWPLGPNISSLSVDGRINGRLPDSENITRSAEAWRDGGGSLEITHLAMGWGPLGLTSSATLALDDELQPMGSGNGRIVGYAETLDRLAAGGMLTKSAATAAKAVLSLMAGTSDTDEPSSVDVPLTLQYRTLSMRQVPLVRLPELDWPPQ